MHTSYAMLSSGIPWSMPRITCMSLVTINRCVTSSTPKCMPSSIKSIYINLSSNLGHFIISVLFRTILTVHFYKNISFRRKIDVSCQIVLQEEFAEEPHTIRGRQLQWCSHESLLNFRIQLDQETNFSFEN